MKKDTESTKKKKFKLRTAPIKPVRKIVRTSFYLYEGISLEEVVTWAKSFPGVSFEKIFIEANRGYYDESDYFEFTLKYNEPDDEFSLRMEDYNTQLADYKKWEKENKEEIKKAKEEQAKINKQRSLKRAEQAKKEAEKKLEAYEKEAARLRKKLGK